MQGPRALMGIRRWELALAIQCWALLTLRADAEKARVWMREAINIVNRVTVKQVTTSKEGGGEKNRTRAERKCSGWREWMAPAVR